MLLTVFNVFYVLIAVAMCVLILLQSGSGAAAGSGFGGGASSTVFGARGASTFLSRSTGVLAGAFFLLSILMGIYMHPTSNAKLQEDLGVMSGMTTPAPAKTAPAAGAIPAVPAAASGSDKPAPTPAPAEAKKDSDKPEAPKKN